MTILTVCRQLSSVIGIDRPSAVVGSTEREHQELTDLAAEMCQRIAQSYPWSLLRKSLTLTAGDEVYDLPADFDYFPEGVQLRVPNGCLEHVTDPDQWLKIQVEQFYQPVWGAWNKAGTQITFDREMVQDVRSFYQTTLWILHDGNPSASILADEDSFRLDERLLFLGMLWQWKANKGLPYAEDFANYNERLAWLVVRDKGTRAFTVGRPRLPRSEQDIFYGTLGTGGSTPTVPGGGGGDPDPDPDPGGGGGGGGGGGDPTPSSGFPYTFPFALA